MFEPAGLGEAELSGLSVPVVALYDEHTAFEATREWLRANVPGCRAETIAGAKHFAPLENPAEFTRLVTTHLRDLAGLERADACTS